MIEVLTQIEWVRDVIPSAARVTVLNSIHRMPRNLLVDIAKLMIEVVLVIVKVTPQEDIVLVQLALLAVTLPHLIYINNILHNSNHGDILNLFHILMRVSMGSVGHM